MGIDIYCEQCKKWLGKQCFSYRRQLLDALRAYLKENKKEHELEFKYLNWVYRYEEDDPERVLMMADEEKQAARQQLRENKLDGLFCWIFLEEEDYISYTTAQKFLESYEIIKRFMNEEFIDFNIFTHAAHYKHGLQCS